MYTKQMHKRIREEAERWYGFHVADKPYVNISYADISELLDEIERLESEIQYFEKQAMFI